MSLRRGQNPTPLTPKGGAKEMKDDLTKKVITLKKQNKIK